MKCILMLILLCMAIAAGALAEEPSAADEFLANLSATWDSLVQMGGEAVDSAAQWVSEDLAGWVNDDVPAWIDGAAQAIEGWLDGAGQWTQEAADNITAFIQENGPAVEAWLNQAGEDVRKAWDTLVNPGDHTGAEVEAAYDTVADALNESRIANPWTTMTREELERVSGVTFGVPEDAEELNWQWLESEKLAQMQFVMDGDEYCARIQPAALEEGQLMDISGMYFDWDHEEAVTIGGCPGTISLAQTGSEDWVELCQWFDAAPGLMYSLSVYTTDPDGLDLTAVADMVYLPAQGEV